MNISVLTLRILVVASFILLSTMQGRRAFALGPMHHGYGKRRCPKGLKNCMSGTPRSTVATRPPIFPPYPNKILVTWPAASCTHKATNGLLWY
uniref:Secreted protein n=1 Tax=Rhipicephalus appendiculatus TaxID=34631 RepID=A0A131YC80_RHIAP